MHRSAASKPEFEAPLQGTPEVIGYSDGFQGHIETASHHEIRGKGTWRSKCGGYAVASVSHGAMAMQRALAMPRTVRLTAPRTKSPEQSQAEDQSEPAHFSQPTQSGRGSGNGRPAPPRPPTFSGDAPGLKVASGPDTAASSDLYDPSTTHHPPPSRRHTSNLAQPSRHNTAAILSSVLVVPTVNPESSTVTTPRTLTSIPVPTRVERSIFPRTAHTADRILCRRDPYLRQLPLWHLKFYDLHPRWMHPEPQSHDQQQAEDR